jgi:hypothetical protein
MSVNEAELSFQDLIISRMDKDKMYLVTSIIERAKRGEASALKVIERFITEAVEDKDEEFPIDEKLFKTIILIAAERIRADQNLG